MGNYILCRREASEIPFHIESVSLNVYSLEELCFFLKENPALAGEVVTSEKLAQWLFEECKAEGAVKEFAALPTEENKISGRLMWLFTKSRLYNEAELRALRSEAEKTDALEAHMRRKKRADALVKYGKYRRGIACYEAVLNEAEPNGALSDKAGANEVAPDKMLPSKADGGMQFRAEVYYNMGAACERLFWSGKALDCFYRAYECVKSDEYLTAYLRAAYFDGGKSRLLSEAERLGADEKLASSVLEEAERASSCDAQGDAMELVDEWVRAYHLGADD